MKLNNKGFAIASILYSIMVLFLMLLLSILGILGSRKAILDKNKKDILDSLNSVVTNNRINFEHRNITIINRGNKDDILFALMDGVTAIDKDGNQINSGNISYNLNVDNIEDGDYTVTYSTNSNGSKIIATRKVTIVSDDISQTFSQTGSSQEFISNYNGSYKIEAWGASGSDFSTYTGGNGAYVSGNINLEKDRELFVFVGSSNGYNGGGTGNSSYGATGGGATDIRLLNDTGFDGLKTRIMVAAGGGSAENRGDGYGAGNGGAGGNLIGIDGETDKSVITEVYGQFPGAGGTQISGGKTLAINNTSNNTTYSNGNASFGLGGSLNAGGGGGYYGGAGSLNSGAGGGSSYVSGYDGCNSIDSSSSEDNIIHIGSSIHYSGYYFKEPVMYAGDELMPTHDGMGNMTGNSGDGYAKISLIYYY